MSTAPAALVIDWGGVLTPALDGALTRWAVGEGIDLSHYRDVMRDWVGGEDSPVHRFERGELPVSQFEASLAVQLSRVGSPVAAQGLVGRMLAGLVELDERMIGAVRSARRQGVRTALLSNSWGEHYPEELWDGLFDVVVISGRVGMRKPEPEIFAHTVEQLGVPAAGCVMVDDMAHNVEAATRAGMVGVLHRTPEGTIGELEQLFGLVLGTDGMARDATGE